MITFSLALVLLIVGYLVYGKFIDRLFQPDASRKTPAITMADGVDFIPLPTWKIFMIQFLNIAGLGPIFGAIMGAQFGTASYLWIVFGTIFAGAVHDFFSGALSIRNSGESLPEIIGRYLGLTTKKVACIFTVLLMILVGAVFVSGPAELLAGMTPDYMDIYFWMVVIFIYYILATMLPIDKIIGRIYPLFAFALLFMAVGILVMLYVKSPELPEMWDGFGTKYEKNPIFPMMFISIACGAISGFHATQTSDGKMYGQREALSPYFLWCNGDRRYSSLDMGCGCYIFLPRKWNSGQGHRHSLFGCEGGYRHFQPVAGHIRWNTCHIGYRCGSYHQW